jgi:hypothetical protein
MTTIVRGFETLLDAVFMDNGGCPRYEVVEYTSGRRGRPTQWTLYSKGPGVVGADVYDDGTPIDEATRAISWNEARAWVQARLDAGDVLEITAREVLEFLDEPQHTGQSRACK